MRSNRSHVSLRTKLAAVLRDLAVERNGRLERALSYEEAKALTDDQILSLFQWDHGIHHAIGGTIQHWNLTARFIAEHRAKTAKIDIPMLAKADRISDAHQEFRRKMLEKSGRQTGQEIGQPKRKKAWPQGQKLRSRPFQKKREPA